MSSSVGLLLVVWTDSLESVDFRHDLSRRFAASPLPRLRCVSVFVWTGSQRPGALCLDEKPGALGFPGKKISVTGCGGLSDNLSRPSRLSRLDRYKMRIRVDLSRHALYISV